MQNFDLAQTLQAMAQDPNDQTRNAAKNTLLQMMNLDVNLHRQYCEFLINNQQNSSVQMIAILFLRNFVDKSIINDENKFKNHSNDLILLYTNCYYQINENDTKIFRLFAETIKEMFLEDYEYEMLKQYLIKILSKENCTGYSNLTRTFILTIELVVKFSCSIYQDFGFIKIIFNQILEFGNLLLDEIYQNLNNQQTLQKLECVLNYFKVLSIFVDLRNYLVPEKQAVILRQIAKIFQLNLGNQNNLEHQEQQILFDAQETRERILLRRAKNKCLKIFKFISKKNFKRIQEEKHILEFIIRSIQCILLEKNFVMTELTEKIVCNGLEIMKLHVRNVNHFTLFDINKSMIFNNIILGYIKVKISNFENLYDDPEKFISDLEDCYSNHHIIQNGFRQSIELYTTMCNTIKDFFSNTFGGMIRDFQKILFKSKNDKITRDDIVQLHTLLTVFVSCSEIDDFGPQQDYKVFELVYNNFDFLCQNVFTAIGVLSIFQNISERFYCQDKISQEDKKNYTSNNIKLVLQFMNYDQDTLQQIKAFRIIEYLSSKTLDSENPELFDFIKFYINDIVTSMFNQILKEREQNVIKMLRNFVKSFCQDISQNNLFNILSQLKQLLLQEKELGIYLELFNLFQEIYEHAQFNIQQIEQIDRMFQECYNVLWTIGTKKDLSEDHILNGLTKIIIKNKYVSNTHLDMIAGLHKIINKDSQLSYKNFIMTLIKFSDQRFTNFHFVEILRLVHPHIKEFFAMEILYYLIVQKNKIIDLESANYVWSMLEPIYNIIMNFDIHFRALLVLCYLNIVLIFNNQNYVQDKVPKVVEIIKMHVLRPQNIFFDTYQRQNIIISLVNIVMRQQFISYFHDLLVKVSIFCVDQFKSLEISAKQNSKYSEVPKMKTTKNHYYDNIISNSEETSESEDEDPEELYHFEGMSNRKYKNAEKRFKIELSKDFGDAELAFGNFILGIKKNEKFYEQYLSLIPFNYEDDIQRYSQLQKVIIDQEKDIIQNPVWFKQTENIDIYLQYIDQFFQEKKIVDQEQNIMFFGNSFSGKSTFINWLLGFQFKLNQQQHIFDKKFLIEDLDSNENYKVFNINDQGYPSMTAPLLIMESLKLNLFEIPDFYTHENSMIRMCAFTLINSLMRLGKNTKLVLVLNYKELMKRKEYIIEKWMKFYQNITIDEDQQKKHQKGSIYFVFNNTPNELTKTQLVQELQEYSQFFHKQSILYPDYLNNNEKNKDSRQEVLKILTIEPFFSKLTIKKLMSYKTEYFVYNLLEDIQRRIQKNYDQSDFLQFKKLYATLQIVQVFNLSKVQEIIKNIKKYTTTQLQKEYEIVQDKCVCQNKNIVFQYGEPFVQKFEVVKNIIDIDFDIQNLKNHLDIWDKLDSNNLTRFQKIISTMEDIKDQMNSQKLCVQYIRKLLEQKQFIAIEKFKLIMTLFKLNCFVQNLKDMEEKEKELQKNIDEELYNCKDIKLTVPNFVKHLQGYSGLEEEEKKNIESNMKYFKICTVQYEDILSGCFYLRNFSQPIMTPKKDEVISLHKAVFYNLINKVKSFVQGKKDLHRPKNCKFAKINEFEDISRRKLTPLSLACIYGRIEILKFFYSVGFEPNTIDSSQQSLLGYACQYGQFQIAKFLVSLGANTQYTSKTNPSMFLNACFTNDQKLMLLLYENQESQLDKDKLISNNILQICMNVYCPAFEFCIERLNKEQMPLQRIVEQIQENSASDLMKFIDQVQIH